MAEYGSLIPINVVTGFLGSGKTTLLQRLLASPDLKDTAVLVNEFGELGLDHHLIESATESTLLLDNGCLCCAVRDDLQGALRDLFSRRERGEVQKFERVVIETSGLADPVPIAYTILAEPVIQHHFRLGNVVATIDAVNGPSQLERFPESVKQAAIADRLIVTKSDLASAETVASLRKSLRHLNASAPIFDANTDTPGATDLLTEDLYTGGDKRGEIEGWLSEASAKGHDHQHADNVESFTVTYDRPLNWTAFGIWLSMLLNRHGENVLRVKGMLNVIGVADPVLINGVQHIVHPPSHLAGWPDADQRSRIVFIVRGIAQDRIERSLAAFNRLANPAAETVTGYEQQDSVPAAQRQVG